MSVPAVKTSETPLQQACLDLIAAKAAIAGHQGPYAGPEWQAKTEALRKAWLAVEGLTNEREGDRK
jgi:hypothetical protein